MAEGPPWLRFYDEGVPAQIQAPDSNLAEMLYESYRRFPRRAALVSSHGSLSYEQLFHEVQKFAGVLAALNVQPQDRVLVMLPNSLQQIVALYGTLYRGCTAVLTSLHFPGYVLAAHLKDSSPRAALVPTPLPEQVDEALREYGPEHLVFCSGREYNRSLRGWLRVTSAKLTAEPSRILRFRQLMQQAQPMPSAHPTGGEQTALILYTGGTTGLPRGVELSHRALWANALQLQAWDPKLQLGKERILGALPLSHSYGFSASLSLSVRSGATLILSDSPEPQHLLELCARFKPSLMPGTPHLYASLLNRRDLRQYGLNSVRACISGAAPLPVEVQEGFEKVTKGRLVEGYGLTEAGPVTHANPLYGKRKSGSIGVPLPSTEARVVDLNTRQDLPAQQVGELLVRGPQLMNGYFEARQLTEMFVEDGWLKTGDLAQYDEDGYFYVLARKSDCVRLGEFTIFPRDIEEVLHQHPAVAEVAVVPWPAPSETTDLGFSVARGLKVFFVARPRAKVDLEELRKWSGRRLSVHQVPGEWQQVESLPRTPFGKVMRRLLYRV